MCAVSLWQAEPAPTAQVWLLLLLREREMCFSCSELNSFQICKHSYCFSGVLLSNLELVLNILQYRMDFDPLAVVFKKLSA